MRAKINSARNSIGYEKLSGTVRHVVMGHLRAITVLRAALVVDCYINCTVAFNSMLSTYIPSLKILGGCCGDPQIFLSWVSQFGAGHIVLGHRCQTDQTRSNAPFGPLQLHRKGSVLRISQSVVEN